jgi:hypothetical protein
VVIVAILVPLLVAGILWLMITSGSAPQEGPRTPSACGLLDRAQVDAYLPGAVADGGGGASVCRWSRPAGSGDDPGRLTVGVETLPGERPAVEEAEERYGIRRRQADEPFTPLLAGDESFLACAPPSGKRPVSCETWTRVSDVVFGLRLEVPAVTDGRDPGSSVRALTTQAVQVLRTASPDDGPGAAGP